MSVDDEAMVQLVAAGPLRTPQEVADFLACDESERALVIDAYRRSGLAREASAWDGFLTVLGSALSVAGLVSGISSAVKGVYDVGKL